MALLGFGLDGVPDGDGLELVLVGCRGCQDLWLGLVSLVRCIGPSTARIVRDFLSLIRIGGLNLLANSSLNSTTNPRITQNLLKTMGFRGFPVFQNSERVTTGQMRPNSFIIDTFDLEI